jgi:hypothetical protein
MQLKLMLQLLDLLSNCRCIADDLSPWFLTRILSKERGCAASSPGCGSRTEFRLPDEHSFNRCCSVAGLDLLAA